MASRLRSNPASGEVSLVRRPAPVVAWRAGRRVSDARAGHAIHPDALFEALDGFELVPGSRYSVRIYSVFDQDDVRWIQCGLEGSGFIGTLCVTVADSPDEIVGILKSWLIAGETAFDALDSSAIWWPSLTTAVH